MVREEIKTRKGLQQANVYGKMCGENSMGFLLFDRPSQLRGVEPTKEESKLLRALSVVRFHHIRSRDLGNGIRAKRIGSVSVKAKGLVRIAVGKCVLLSESGLALVEGGLVKFIPVKSRE